MLTVLQIINSHNNNSDTCLEGLSLDNKYASIQVSIFFFEEHSLRLTPRLLVPDQPGDTNPFLSESTW